jgi:DNA-binding NtrC family response regulator
LREASVAQLSLLGYEMLQAADSTTALSMIEHDGKRIDLLFTDIVMPGALNGYELAQAVTARHPGIKVLLASGFPGETLKHNGAQSKKWPLLKKPYRMEELGRAVHAALHSGSSEVQVRQTD